MREFCLTEEVIQQFVDGELSPQEAERAAAHLAACDDCASLLDEVEQGNALLVGAFAPELGLPVPTLRLRERLDTAIAGLEPRPRVASQSAGSRLRGWFGSLLAPLSFTPQRAFGFASLAIVVAFAGVFALIQLRHKEDAGQQIAGNNGSQPVAQPVTPPAPVQSPQSISNAGLEPSPTAPEVTNAVNQRTTTGRASVKRTDKTSVPAQAKSETATPPAAPVEPKLLPGEEGYLEAIASLTNAIEANKDDVLKPTVRVDYERNLAVVDQAIATTRQQARRNPKDRDAAEFMYTAYQNKIELLSAVADQTRLASR